MLLALALMAGSCTPDSPAGDAGSRADALAGIALELGTGQASFVSLPPSGASVELVHGPQGGYHILGRVRFRGFPPDVFTSFRVTPEKGGDPINDPTDRVHRLDQRGLVRIGDEWESSFAELVVLTAIHSPDLVVGRRFRWEVFVQNAATGQVATTEREITVVDELP